MKKLLLAFIAANLVLAAAAQEKPPHPDTIVKADDGKIYVNKNLGIYMFIGSEPNPSKKLMRLENSMKEEVTNPFYFDTEGINTIRSPWAVDPETKNYIRPRQDVRFNLYADSRPPQTRAYKGNKRITTLELLINPKETISIKARDAISGVKTIYYSIDGNPYKAYEKPVSFSEEKEYILKFYAVDIVGNDEKVHVMKIKVDATAPETSMQRDGPHHKDIFSAKGVFTLKSTDKMAGTEAIYYRIDSNEMTRYAQPIQLKNLREGRHSIAWYAIDKAGNREKTRSYSFYIDKTPPRIVQQITGDRYYANGKAYSSGRSKIEITAADNRAGVKAIYYRINKGQQKQYKEPVFLPATQGNMQITAYATDSVGNSSRGEVAEQDQFKITYRDLTGPELRYWWQGPTVTLRDSMYISPNTKIACSIKDKESGAEKITYRLNGGEEKTYKEPLRFTKGGAHTLQLTGYDNVNNTSSKKLHFTVDNQGPEIYHHFSIVPLNASQASQDTLTYPLYAKLYLSATDKSTGVEIIGYHINNSSFRPYNAPIEAFNQQGFYSLKIVASDQMGNQTTRNLPVKIVR